MYKKTILTLACAALITTSFAQKLIVPGKGLADQKLIKNQEYTMTWNMLKDSNSINIGLVKTRVEANKKQVLVITQVDMKGAKSSWIDSTVVNARDFSPVYHSSYNTQRDMVLHFGNAITGYYLDHTSKQRSAIQDTIQQPYFDSNFYPMLITWLPLDANTKADINIYDYNPKGKTGVMQAHIQKVTAATYHTKRSGVRPVWVMEVNDEINPTGNTKMTYLVDQQSRQLYQQSISTGKMKMEMVLVEE